LYKEKNNISIATCSFLYVHHPFVPFHISSYLLVVFAPLENKKRTSTTEVPSINAGNIVTTQHI